MSDEEFLQKEREFDDALAKFKESCDENGMDFECRVGDLVHDAINDQ